MKTWRIISEPLSTSSLWTNIMPQNFNNKCFMMRCKRLHVVSNCYMASGKLPETPMTLHKTPCSRLLSILNLSSDCIHLTLFLVYVCFMCTRNALIIPCLIFLMALLIIPLLIFPISICAHTCMCVDVCVKGGIFVDVFCENFSPRFMKSISYKK